MLEQPIFSFKLLLDFKKKKKGEKERKKERQKKENM
jgi:hypothetical protein